MSFYSALFKPEPKQVLKVKWYHYTLQACAAEHGATSGISSQELGAEGSRVWDELVLPRATLSQKLKHKTSLYSHPLINAIYRRWLCKHKVTHFQSLPTLTSQKGKRTLTNSIWNVNIYQIMLGSQRPLGKMSLQLTHNKHVWRDPWIVRPETLQVDHSEMSSQRRDL